MTTRKKQGRPPICPVIDDRDLIAIATGEQFETMALSGTPDPITPLRRVLASDLTGTARDRLVWLTDRLAYAKLDHRDSDALRRLWARVLIQVDAATSGRWIVESNPPMGERDVPRWSRSVPGRRGGPVRITSQATQSEALVEAQRRLRRLLEDAADGKAIEAYAATARPIMGDDSKMYYLAPLEDAIGVATLMLVEEISRERLRRCVYRHGGAERGEVCGRVFVASKRQKYCDAHRADARREQLKRAQERHRQKALKANVAKKRTGRMGRVARGGR